MEKNKEQRMITIDMIPSKSFAHRALICAALAGEADACRCDFPSKDIEATKACLAAIREGRLELPCGESGSTLRFLLPVLGALGRRGAFYAEGRLPQRPLDPLDRELRAHGCKLTAEGENPIVIEGKLTAGEYLLPGNISSQYISGLLMALPLLEEACSIRVTEPLESSAYIDMTLEVVRAFGVSWRVEREEGERCYRLDGRQHYHAPSDYHVEGDWSGAAFWIAAGAIGNRPIRITGLNQNSIQGDRRMVEIAQAFSADVQVEEEDVIVSPSRLRASRIDVSEVPDLAPAIAILAAYAEGRSEIVGARRLRIKESDRLEAIANTLRTLGCRVEEEEESLSIFGSGGAPLAGGCVDGYNDHRIVMMAAILSLRVRSKVQILGKEAVAKSYPTFFEELERAGLNHHME